MDFGSGVVRADDACEMPDLVGTPRYIAPELLAGSPATIASDVYSIGILLYHLVTLDFPSRDTRDEAIPLSDRRPDLPVSFAWIVSRALAQVPSDRYQSTGEMQKDLVLAIGPALCR
jgi:eukaryotic-like serine/threonine-protein kinase